MTADGFHQSYGSAQCALLAILNALNILFGPISEDDAGHIQAAMARTLEGTGGRDLATVLFEDGTGRAQARRMLRAAQAWTASMGWRPFLVDMQHPKTGEKAVDFWKDIAGCWPWAECSAAPVRSWALATMTGRTAATRLTGPAWSVLASAASTFATRPIMGAFALRRPASGLSTDGLYATASL
jgi:hypothetical protein